MRIDAHRGEEYREERRLVSIWEKHRREIQLRRAGKASECKCTLQLEVLNVTRSGWHKFKLGGVTVQVLGEASREVVRPC